MEELEKRRDYLLAIIKSKEKALKNTPKCNLRILKRGNHVFYYKIEKPGDTNGVYIRKKDIALAERIAQRDYDRLVLDLSKKELKLLEQYRTFSAENRIEDIYSSCTETRKKLVVPVAIPDNEYINAWKSVTYDCFEINDDTISYYSNNGIRVRSKSEALIANMLEHYNVPYRYEYPLEINGVGVIRPDFLCLNVKSRKEIVWEHFGMMDNIAYANKNVRKINIFEQYGYMPGDNLIMTFETSQFSIDTENIKNKIEMYLCH